MDLSLYEIARQAFEYIPGNTPVDKSVNAAFIFGVVPMTLTLIGLCYKDIQDDRRMRQPERAQPVQSELPPTYLP